MTSSSLLPFFALPMPGDAVRVFGERLITAQHILIISHRNPDGDTIGAGCALFHTLTKLNKHTELFCIDPIPERLRWLPGSRHYTTTLPDTTPDMIIVVDTNSFENTGVSSYINKHIEQLIIIDHHQFSPSIKGFPIIVPESCSTTALLYCMFELLRLPICLDTSTALLEGIYWDTGGLRHSNTDYHAYRIAGTLISHGADHKRIIRELFQTNPISQLRLWGTILNRARIHNAYPITYTLVHEQDLISCGASSEEINGVIDYLNSIPEQWCSILFSLSQETLRVSLRSQRDDIDLSKLARHFGGGGHKKAAGFTIPLSLLSMLNYSAQK